VILRAHQQKVFSAAFFKKILKLEFENATVILVPDDEKSWNKFIDKI